MKGRSRPECSPAERIPAMISGAAVVAGVMLVAASVGRAGAGKEDTWRVAQASPGARAPQGALEEDAARDRRRGRDVDILSDRPGSAGALVQVPLTDLFPGPVPLRPTVPNPGVDDPAAIQRGMEYFNQMNCVGCHAPNGAGGMGPSLSNAKFVYGGEPENIFLTILQGRPNGMPAWGGVLPDQVIWDLVAYIRSISKAPAAPWGKTTSADGFTIEQVPSEYIKTTEPWRYTSPFSYGQKPSEKPKGAPPLETPRQ